MENKEPSDKVIIKYSSYTPAQKRATQKYRQNNKEKVNEQRKKYYQERKEKDPGFLEYKRTKAKEYYQRKKVQKEELKTPEEVIIEHVEEHKPDIQEILQEPIPEPVVQPTPTPSPTESTQPVVTLTSQLVHIYPVQMLPIV